MSEWVQQELPLTDGIACECGCKEFYVVEGVVYSVNQIYTEPKLLMADECSGKPIGSKVVCAMCDAELSRDKYELYWRYV